MKDRQATTLWMRWVCLIIGMGLSTYATMQVLLWASEVVRVDRSDPDNPFRWEKIRLNLPGDTSYSPTIPWMSKFQGGGFKIWPYILQPMWMTTYWRQGQKKRCGGQPGEWGRFGNTWDYNIPQVKVVCLGKTEFRGEGQSSTS